MGGTIEKHFPAGYDEIYKRGDETSGLTCQAVCILQGVGQTTQSLIQFMQEVGFMSFYQVHLFQRAVGNQVPSALLSLVHTPYRFHKPRKSVLVKDQ